MGKRCVEVLRDCDAKFDSDLSQQARCFKLSEEDVDRTMRSWAMEKFEQEPFFTPTLSVSPLSLNSGSCGASVVDSVTSFPFPPSVDSNSVARTTSSSESNSPPHSPRQTVCRRLEFLRTGHYRHQPEPPVSLDLQHHSHPRRLHSCSHSPLKSRPRYHSPRSQSSSTRIASFRERETTAPPIRVRTLLTSANETPNDDD